MDILRRGLAPISDIAWQEIDETAVDVLTSVLSARKVVDVDGPKGWNYAALPLGRIDTSEDQKEDVKYGIHLVQPLVETRVPFELNMWELDNVIRGAKDIDLGAMEDAARKIAKFEESAIYNGFDAGCIKGLKASSEYEPVTLSMDDDSISLAVAEAMAKLKEAAVEGPYSLVVNIKLWQRLNSYVKGYPLKKQIENLIGGSIVMSPCIDDAFLLSERGGDFNLTIGQDISIGYESHTSKTIQLYFTESFTFQVTDPAAVVVLK
ncbi:family 1 encapsulin nanocompartment shell protein [Marinilabiliaceae bacterium ANBcel2]|nr:family 1 encapsulin nanocompartment shell protein [Marinilabiliaceae bacterium ANBcel2]